MSDAVKMPCIYRPKPDGEAALLDLVKRHWPAIHAAGLTTDEPATLFQATDKRSERVYFVEQFSWIDEEASRKAHGMPEVQAAWGPMGDVLESMELAQIEPIYGV